MKKFKEHFKKFKGFIKKVTAKTWFSTAAIAVYISVIALIIDINISKRQEIFSIELSKSQKNLAIAQTLDNYFTGIGDALIKNDKRGINIINGRTRSLFTILESKDDFTKVVQFLGNLQIVEKIDLSGINLSGADFKATRFVNVNFNRSNLTACKFQYAKIGGGIIHDGNLKRANEERITKGLKPLSYKDVQDENPDEIILQLFSTLQGAKFIEANLDSVNFQWTRLHGALFKNCKMRYAKFNKSDEVIWEDIDYLPESYLLYKETYITNSELYYTDFDSVDLRYSNFENANCAMASFEKSNLSNTNFNKANLYAVSMENSVLDHASLIKAMLYGGLFNNSSFVNADLTSANLSYADLSGSNFTGANFKQAILDNANLTNADLRDTKNLSLNQLLKAKSLYKAKLNDFFLKEIIANNENLLKQKE